MPASSVVAPDEQPVVEVTFVPAGGGQLRSGGLGDLEAWRERGDGFVWLHADACDDELAAVLRDQLGMHPQAVQAMQERSHLPTFHGYPDAWFVVTHRPLLRRRAGHVHLLQLAALVRDDVLVTVHGPHSAEVNDDEVRHDTDGLRRRLAAARLTPRSPSELAHALFAALARTHEAILSTIATRVADLEQEVMTADFRRPEDLSDRMFLVRHELMTIRTMSGDVDEVFDRMASLQVRPPFNDHALYADLADRFRRIRAISDGEREFLAGIIDYYETRMNTKMTIAMERLAVLAAVTLPITALASVYGMNVIVNDRTESVQLIVAIAVMLVISGLLLRWTKRQGWW